jgi:N,N'-diacetyllegionaminate synthase
MAVEIIAEVGQAHEGSLGMAHSFIDALADAGVDTVKFQVHIAEAESSAYEPFRTKFSIEDVSRYDYWMRMSFLPEQWAGLQQHCKDKSVRFLASPFSMAAVDLLEKLGAQRYKIGSGEVTNGLMLARLASIGKPLLLSNGLADQGTLDQAIFRLKEQNVPVTLLQCTTEYPSMPANWQLKQIPILKERYQVPIGYSDHSAHIGPCIAAVSMGATVIEFHATFSRMMFGPDSQASLTMQEVGCLCKEIRLLNEAMNEENITPPERIKTLGELRQMFGKSLCVNKGLPQGHTLSFEDLETKKPAGKGIPSQRWEGVIGKQLARNMDQWTFLQEDDLI